MRILLISAAMAIALQAAEVIDRIAVVVGDEVVTRSEIDREIRVTALLNGVKPQFTEAVRRETADRLVEQALIRREMSVSRFPKPSPGEAQPLLDQLKSGQFREYGLKEEDVRQHLLWQITTMQFIEFRFRPSVRVAPADVRDYYDSEFVAAWKKDNPTPPPAFEQVRAKIEQTLADRLVDQALDRWINQQRTQTRIQFYKEGPQ